MEPTPKDALKDGFYAGRFSPAEAADLVRTRPDLLDEIALLRVYIRRLSAALDGRDTYVDDDLKMLNAMAVITRAVGFLIRVQASPAGRFSAMEKALEEAIHSQRETWLLA